MKDKQLLQELAKLNLQLAHYSENVAASIKAVEASESVDEFELLVGHALRTGDKVALQRARQMIEACSD